MMTPKEELIQAIERSPDGIVQELLAVLKVLQPQKVTTEIAQSSSQRTVLERMGGVPKYLLSDGNLSDRDNRRTLIATRLQQNYPHDS